MATLKHKTEVISNAAYTLAENAEHRLNAVPTDERHTVPATQYDINRLALLLAELALAISENADTAKFGYTASGEEVTVK